MSSSICRYRGSKMCKGRGTPGNNTTGRGKSGSSCCPRTLSLASLIYLIGSEGIMADRRAGPQRRRKKSAPAIRVGQRERGPSSTPSDEEGFHLRCFYGRQRECASGCQRICANSSSL